MKVEAWIFFILGLFFIPVVLVYIVMGGEPVGIGGLILGSALCLMIAGYIRISTRKMDDLPEEDDHALISDYPGVQGEFSPWSWWPLPLGLCAALVFFGLAVGYWVSVIGAALGALALIGWVYEYYRGAHAH